MQIEPDPDLTPRPKRKDVSVSPAMRHLRKVQSRLNGFFWTTELCYAHFLDDPTGTWGDLDRMTSDALEHVTAEAWFSTDKGTIKYDAKMSSTLLRVKENLFYLCTPVITAFFSAFEEFLKSNPRILQHLSAKGAGNYPVAFSVPAFVAGAYGVELVTLAKATICKEIRNALVHVDKKPFLGRQDTAVKEFENTLTKKVMATKVWPEDQVRRDIKKAFDDVVGNAEMLRANSLKSGKNHPIEYYYMLFSFTNLDNMAFELEQAVFDENDRPTDSIVREDDRVRRKGMIIDDTTKPERPRAENNGEREAKKNGESEDSPTA